MCIGNQEIQFPEQTQEKFLLSRFLEFGPYFLSYQVCQYCMDPENLLEMYTKNIYQN